MHEAINTAKIKPSQTLMIDTVMSAAVDGRVLRSYYYWRLFGFGIRIASYSAVSLSHIYLNLYLPLAGHFFLPTFIPHTNWPFSQNFHIQLIFMPKSSLLYILILYQILSDVSSSVTVPNLTVKRIVSS